MSLENKNPSWDKYLKIENKIHNRSVLLLVERCGNKILIKAAWTKVYWQPGGKLDMKEPSFLIKKPLFSAFFR